VRVFLDTNVLVRAFATRGLCADIVRSVLAEHDLITIEFVLAELERVLKMRLVVPTRNVHAILVLLRRFDVELAPEDTPQLVIRGPDDLNVLAAALASQADVLVTGDKNPLVVKDEVDITITDPRGFWNMLKKRPRE
jgi:putative PIN family toxin of toxin-antitoxin system